MFFPAIVLAAGYDAAAFSGYRVLYSETADPNAAWVELAPVCLQASSTSSTVEVAEAKTISASTGTYALRVGAADGRIYYLIPRNATERYPQLYGLATVPTTAIVEREALGVDGTCG
jgi:hypothetical protein